MDEVRALIPDVTLSSDFICGFCGETDEEFSETLSLIQRVKYHTAFLFAYSMREVCVRSAKITFAMRDQFLIETILLTENNGPPALPG